MSTPVVSSPAEWACVAWACGGGLCNALSVNVIAWPTHLQKKWADNVEEESSRALWLLLWFLNLAFALSSMGCFFTATAKGPVAMAMPILVVDKW